MSMGLERDWARIKETDSSLDGGVPSNLVS